MTRVSVTMNGAEKRLLDVRNALFRATGRRISTYDLGSLRGRDVMEFVFSSEDDALEAATALEKMYAETTAVVEVHDD